MSTDPSAPPRRQITADLIDLGAPLPVDLYDSRHRLLLRRGVVISTRAQLDRLMEEGLYGDAAEVEALAERRHGAAPPHRHRQTPYAGIKLSVCELLGDVRQTLWKLLAAPPVTGFADRIAPLVLAVRRAAELDPDAALGQAALDRSFPPSVRHLVNVAAMVAALLHKAGRPGAEIDVAVAAALTMNLTSLALQDALYAQAGPLDSAQRAVIDAHPLAALERLRALGVRDDGWLLAVVQHHELHDGSGYPARRRGADICLPARAITLADQVCALLAERAYREPVNGIAVMKKLREAPPASLDPGLCAALCELMTPYPPGSAVRLVTDDLAIVSRRTRQPTAPTVMVFVTRMRQRLEQPRKKLAGNELTAIAEPVNHSQIQPPVRPREVWDEVFAPEEHGLP